MSATAARTASRWDHYLLRRGGECASFWKDYLADSNRQLLLILGLGFDPRMCLGLRMLLEARPSCVKQCLLIEYDEGANSPSHQYGALVKSNRDGLSSLLGHPGAIQTARVPMWSDDRRRRTGSRRASDVIQPNILERFTDIVVDVQCNATRHILPTDSKNTVSFGCINRSCTFHESTRDCAREHHNGQKYPGRRNR